MLLRFLLFLTLLLLPASAAVAITLPSGFQHRRDLDRVMPVVVDNRDAVHFIDLGEAPVDPAERRHRRPDLVLGHAKVPRDREALEALPGVGRKTANVVMNTAFGESTIAVDTHIFRVANRTGLAPGRNVREVEDGLVAVTPAEFARDAHHLLILHGRYTCVARKPRCPACPVRDICRWPHKTAAPPPLTSSG